MFTLALITPSVWNLFCLWTEIRLSTRVPIHRTLRTGHTGHFAEKTTKVHRTVVSQGYLPN